MQTRFNRIHVILLLLFFSGQMLAQQANNSIFTKLQPAEFAIFKISSQNCNGFVYRSGSRIYVPTEAFVSSDGRVYKGEITLLYREFHDALDIVIAGISMRYKNGKKEHILESVGMFEIYAEAEGNPLSLAPGKTIQVRFASRSNRPGADAYQYDFNKGLWIRRKDYVVSDSPVTPSEETNRLWGSSPLQPRQQDNMAEEVYDDWDSEWGWSDRRDATTTPASNNRLTLDDYSSSQLTQMATFKIMNIDQMGLFNYDFILNDSESIPISASFSILKSQQKVQQRIYVIYEGINTAVYYLPHEWTGKFALLPRKGIKIFSVTDNGKVLVYEGNELEPDNIYRLKNKKFSFYLSEENLIPNTKEELAELLGLEL